ncbi:MAG TPA: c-type cytochrome domain-containing protein [Planctomycetaceae bacterium]|nr:c-type cytochrome domain-containing protein [Planctomycetaceae bacterium]
MLMHVLPTMRRIPMWSVSLALICGLVTLCPIKAADPSTSTDLFENKVRPVLVDVCFKCHGGEKVSGGLRVDSREALLKGGDSGASIVPNQPGESPLLKAIRHEDKDFQMPPDKKLPDETIAAFETWIAGGAVWPQDKSGGFEAKRHWAFQPIVSPKVPEIQNQKSKIPSTPSSGKSSTPPAWRCRPPPTLARCCGERPLICTACRRRGTNSPSLRPTTHHKHLSV